MTFKYLKAKLKQKHNDLYWWAFSVMVMVCPSLCRAVTLEEQLTRIQKLATGTGLKTGIAIATVIGAVYAMARHSIQMVLVVIAIGVALSYYLEWVLEHDFTKGATGGATL